MLPLVSAAREAKRQRDPGFTDGIPSLPETHLIVPRGFREYKMQREEYNDDMAMRDLEHHLRRTWAQV